MRKIIQNNHNTWHAGVDAIDRLPDGSNPLPPGSWERFAVKLEAQERQQKKKRVYLLAASISSLIILLSVGTYVWNSNTNKPGNTIVIKNNIPATPLTDTDSSTNPNNVVTTNTASPVIKAGPSTRPQQKLIQPSTAPDTFNQNPVVVNSIDTPFDIQPEKPALVVQAPSKQRYRVKHMNDFADTLESTPGMTIKVKPLIQYMWPVENSAKAILDQPVKEHNINPSPNNPN